MGLGSWCKPAGAGAILRLTPAIIPRANAWLDRLLTDQLTGPPLGLGESTAIAHRQRATEFFEWLGEAVTSLSPNTIAEAEPLRRAPFDLVNTLFELIREAPVGEPPSIRTLAERLQISVRTLEKAFAVALVMPPQRYLLAYRLENVHRLLVLGDSRSVAEAARAVGFEHAGRFSQQYRMLFGENPSATFRRAKGLSSGESHEAPTVRVYFGEFVTNPEWSKSQDA